jgi:branched-chain amino acid transport system substrate-binding protein
MSVCSRRSTLLGGVLLSGSALLGGLLLSASLALSGCKKAEPASQDRTEIRIGATLPLTGAEARIGGFFKEGYELAIEQANKAGGVQVGARRLPVKLTLLDDTTNQAAAVSLADRLVNSDKVDFLLGTYSTSLVEAQSTVAEQSHVPYVNGGGAATATYQRKYQYLFGLLAPVELLGRTLMQWIDEQQQAGKLPKPARIALLWENTSHGKDFRRGVSEFAEHSGGNYQVAVDESFELNGKDFSALLGKVKAAHTDLFLADAHLPDFITLQRQYVSLGLCHPLLSYGARGAEVAARDALGPENVGYILSAVWWSSALAEKSPASKAFVELFRAKYQRVPEWYQALGYETARVLLAAIEQAKSADRDTVRKALSELRLPSLLPGGEVSFPAAQGGQAYYPFVVQQNLPGGASPIIYPKDIASAAGVAPNPNCAAH